MSIKTILFDADGVVINAEMFSLKYQKEFGVSNDKMLPFFTGVFKDCLVGKNDLKKVIKPYLKDWQWQGSANELLTYWFKAEHQVDKNIIKLISKLRTRGIKCYLVMNQEKYRTAYIKKEMGLRKVFDKIYVSCQIGYKKPHINFYKFVYQDLIKSDKLKKSEILYFDDLNEAVKTAKTFGIHSYLYTGFRQLHETVKKSISSELK